MVDPQIMQIFFCKKRIPSDSSIGYRGCGIVDNSPQAPSYPQSHSLDYYCGVPTTRRI
jgi:hypothetical protein